MLPTLIGSPQRTEVAMHVHRFVVFRVKHEWFVVYEDRRRLGFATREEAEASAFGAADTAFSQGHTTSVLVWLL
jgi:hypothetical protein